MNGRAAIRFGVVAFLLIACVVGTSACASGAGKVSSGSVVFSYDKSFSQVTEGKLYDAYGPVAPGVALRLAGLDAPETGDFSMISGGGADSDGVDSKAFIVFSAAPSDTALSPDALRDALDGFAPDTRYTDPGLRFVKADALPSGLSRVEYAAYETHSASNLEMRLAYYFKDGSLCAVAVAYLVDDAPDELRDSCEQVLVSAAPK